MKDYLTHLSVQYQGIAPVYEEYESYFKVIDLFKKVSLVFIFLSFIKPLFSVTHFCHLSLTSNSYSFYFLHKKSIYRTILFEKKYNPWYPIRYKNK